MLVLESEDLIVVVHAPLPILPAARCSAVPVFPHYALIASSLCCCHDRSRPLYQDIRGQVDRYVQSTRIRTVGALSHPVCRVRVERGLVVSVANPEPTKHDLNLRVLAVSQTPSTRTCNAWVTTLYAMLKDQRMKDGECLYVFRPCSAEICSKRLCLPSS